MFLLRFDERGMCLFSRSEAGSILLEEVNSFRVIDETHNQPE
jgi:hypothetical protein